MKGTSNFDAHIYYQAWREELLVALLRLRRCTGETDLPEAIRRPIARQAKDRVDALRAIRETARSMGADS